MGMRDYGVLLISQWDYVLVLVVLVLVVYCLLIQDEGSPFFHTVKPRRVYPHFNPFSHLVGGNLGML